MNVIPTALDAVRQLPEARDAVPAAGGDEFRRAFDAVERQQTVERRPLVERRQPGGGEVERRSTPADRERPQAAESGDASGRDDDADRDPAAPRQGLPPGFPAPTTVVTAIVQMPTDPQPTTDVAGATELVADVDPPALGPAGTEAAAVDVAAVDVPQAVTGAPTADATTGAGVGVVDPGNSDLGDGTSLAVTVARGASVDPPTAPPADPTGPQGAVAPVTLAALASEAAPAGTGGEAVAEEGPSEPVGSGAERDVAAAQQGSAALETDAPVGAADAVDTGADPETDDASDAAPDATGTDGASAVGTGDRPPVDPTRAARPLVGVEHRPAQSDAAPAAPAEQATDAAPGVRSAGRIAAADDAARQGEIRRAANTTRIGMDVATQKLGAIRVDAFDGGSGLHLNLGADRESTRILLAQQAAELGAELSADLATAVHIDVGARGHQQRDDERGEAAPAAGTVSRLGTPTANAPVTPRPPAPRASDGVDVRL